MHDSPHSAARAAWPASVVSSSLTRAVRGFHLARATIQLGALAHPGSRNPAAPSRLSSGGARDRPNLRPKSGPSHVVGHCS
jgi:hypothetical protein